MAYLKQPKKTSLTARELQVARLLLASKTSYEMSLILGIAEGTISAHLSSVYAFHGVSNRYAFLNLVYSNPELRTSLIGEQSAMTHTLTPAALQASGAEKILAERNASDLSLKLGDATPYAYPLGAELINAAFDRNMPALLREGPTVWAGFLQGDLRFVIDRVNAVAPPDLPQSGEAFGETVLNQGHQVASARMTAWLYVVRAAAMALCGSERQQANALDAAEAACAVVAGSQLLPWSLRVTRIFVHACMVKSPAGLDRMLQIATEIETLNPLRLYMLTLAIRLADHIGVTQRETQKAIMLLLIKEADAAREDIQRRSSATVFNIRSHAASRYLGPDWIKVGDGRYAHQCLPDDPDLDAWLLLESQILRETKSYADVIAEFPQYREQLRLAHVKLRVQRTQQLARNNIAETP